MTKRADVLSRNAQHMPEKIAAYTVGGPALDYATLDQRSASVAALFQSLGLKTGDRIGTMLGNSAVTLPIWWGARRAGLYFIPLSPRMRGAELTHILRDSDAKLLVADAGAIEAALEAKIALGTDGPTHWFTHGASEADWADLAIDALSMSPSEWRIPSHAGREMIFSSGTTGRPKGIERALTPWETADQLPDLERQMRIAYQLDQTTIYLSASPIYHATGRFLTRVIESGGTNVILPQFEPATALAALRDYGVTHSQWVPTMFNRLLALPASERAAFQAPAHRIALHAAAPCPVPVKHAMIDWWGPILIEYYGGSENAGVTMIDSEAWLSHIGSVGRSIGGAIHIVDPENPTRERATGEIGLVTFEGGVAFTYLDGTTGAASSTPKGYASYGDLGHVDNENYLYLSGRRNDLIIRGGVNVYPAEVEMVIRQNPAVRDVAVVGRTDPEYGEAVVAVICTDFSNEAREALVAELDAQCRAALSSVKCPREFHFSEALPHNENGKLLKRAIRDAIETGRPIDG
ncbi:MAG: AMP-dependent synthetase and ligase [Sphingomonadales bacterium]|nr:AMP-dependent synthetase and ligase [Sphingomonadales bacterium]